MYQNAPCGVFHVIVYAADNAPHSFDGNTVSENAEPIMAWPLHSTAIEYAAEAVSVYAIVYVGDDDTAVGIAAAARVVEPCCVTAATILVDVVLVFKLSQESLTVTVKVAALPAVASVIAEPDAYEKLEHVTPGSTVVTTFGDA